MIARRSPIARMLGAIVKAIEVGARCLMHGTIAIGIVLAAIMSAAFGRKDRG